MSDSQDIQRAATRVERAIDEAHSRFAGAPEADRVQGMAAAVRHALASEAKDVQSEILSRLRELYPRLEPRAEDPATAAELERLRGELESARRQPPQAPAPAPRAAADAAGLVTALLGTEGGRGGDMAADAERAVDVVRSLSAFALDLGRAFLGAAAKAGETMLHVDRFKAALRGELAGTQPAGTVAKLLDEVKLRVAGQIEAFPTACTDGARQMLKELDPLVIQDQAQGDAAKRGGFRLFQHRELWEAYQRRYDELMAAEDLFQTFFDGPLRRALYRLQEKK